MANHKFRYFCYERKQIGWHPVIYTSDPSDNHYQKNVVRTSVVEVSANMTIDQCEFAWPLDYLKGF